MEENTKQQAHREFAVEAFNSCWELIRQAGRSPEEDRGMIRLAEVSFWHWLQYEGHTPKNEAIGHWQLARVHALAGNPQVALTHARRNLEIAQSGKLGAFYEGYAHEAMARAHRAEGNEPAFRQSLDLASACAEAVTDEESLRLLDADLRSLRIALDP